MTEYTKEIATVDELIAQLTPLVWHVARGNGLSKAAAERVVQRVWLALPEDRLGEPRALVGWLVATTRREANRVREETGAAPVIEEDVARRERALWSAFHALPQKCQELLRLTVLADQVDYLAEALHLPADTSERGRCVQNLRSLYAAGR